MGSSGNPGNTWIRNVITRGREDAEFAETDRGKSKRLSMIYSPMNRIPKNPIEESVWLVCSATPWLRVLSFRAHFPEFPDGPTNVARHSWRS